MRGERISLHELTALRVDLTGERARHPMPRSRKHASGSRDPRGNVIATRPFMNRKRTFDTTEPDVVSQEVVQAGDGIEQEFKSKKRRRDNYIPDLLPFLHPPTNEDPGLQVAAGRSGNDDLPTSDLLKSIHHFASCYYDERGMLTAAARKAKIARRQLERVRKEGDSDIDEDESEISESDDGDTSSSQSSSPQLRRSPRKAVRRESRSRSMPPEKEKSSESSKNGTEENSSTSARSKDMFRAFDGSTLLLIGMVLQSHLVSRLDHPPPPSEQWEDQIRDDQETLEKRSRLGRRRQTPQPEPMDETDQSDESAEDEQLDEDKGDTESEEDKDDEEDIFVRQLVETDDEEDKTDFDLGGDSEESD